MVKYWKQIVLLFATLMVAGAFFCLHDPLITRGAQWYLKKFSIKYLDGELHAKKVYLENGALILEKPRIEKREKNCQPRVGASGEKMVLEYSIHPLEMRVDIHVAVDHPTLYIDEESPSLEDFFAKIMDHSNFTRVNTSIELTNGEALLQGPEGPLRHVLFNLNAVSMSSGDYEGHLTVDIDDRKNNHNAFNVNAKKGVNEPLMVQCSFENMDCVALFRLAKFLSPSIDPWSVYGGSLDGALSIVFPEEDAPYCEGEALMRGFTVANTDLRLSGDVEEARLVLKKNTDDSSWEGMPSTVGLFEMSKPTSVVFYRFGRPFWELRDLKGFVALQPNEGADLSFTGKCTHRQRSFDMTLQGEGRFPENNQGSVNMELCLSSEDRDDATVRFSARQLGNLWDCAEVVLKNFSQDEFALIQEPLVRYSHDLGKVHVHGGSLDASVIAYLQDYRVTDVKIDKIAARNLEFAIVPLDVAVSVGEAYGELTVSCLPQDILETLNADFKIHDGQLKVAAGNNKFWRFKDINTQIGIRKGVFQRSILKGEFAGLWGSVEVDWNDPSQVMKLCFNGKAESLKNLAPQKIMKGIEHAFSDDHVALCGIVTRQDNLLNVNGELTISQRKRDQQDCIAFGFDLEKSSDPFWEYWAGHPPSSTYWEDIGVEAMRTMMPELASPTMILQRDWLKRKSGIAGLVIQNGWFIGKNLALEKYIAPYCFEGTAIELSGTGDFEGVYDHKTLAVKYNAYKMRLENHNFLLTTNSLSDHEGDTVKPASHYFDIENGTHFGFIPLRNASYLEKNNDLLFSDAHADVTLESGKIYFHDVETFLNGMYLAGTINIDYTQFSEGVLDIDIFSHTMNGRLSHIQDLAPQLSQYPILNAFATDGKLKYRGNGAYMKFHFVPEECHFDAGIQGAVTEGCCSYSDKDMAVEELSFNFDYRHHDQFFEISDINGTVSVGQANQKEEFLLAGDHIRLNNIAKYEGEFDIWFGDKSRDLVRLVGTTNGLDDEPTKACFSLNKELTHFGNFHPGAFSLTLKNGIEIEKFNLNFNFQLDHLTHDLGLFANSGLFVSPETLRSLKDIKKADGEFTANFSYDDQEAKFLYSVKGNHVTIGEKIFETILLEGKNKDGVWIVDQLLLDKYSIAADIVKEENIWNVNFLGIRCGESILVGLEGKYDADAYVFDARVNLLEVNLEALGEWPAFAEYITTFCPNGVLRGTGQARIEKEKDRSKWKTEALLTTSLRSLGLKGLQFKDTENISCHFVSKRGITLRRIDTSLMTLKDKLVQGLISLEKFDYDFTSGMVAFEDLNFNIPSDSLPWLTENLQQIFPDTVTPSVAQTLQESKKQGNLEGSLSWNLSPKGKNLTMRLNEGTYHFAGSDHTFNNFTMNCDPYEMSVLTQYHYNQDVFWVRGIAAAPTFNKGVMVLTEVHPEQMPHSCERRPLTAEWEIDPLYGLQFIKAQGDIEGLSVNLQIDRDRPRDLKKMNMLGSIRSNIRESKQLLPKEVGDSLASWNFGRGYEFSGQWTYQKEETEEYDKGIHLLGKVGGKDFECKGYVWDTLTANIDYAPKKARITDLQIVDRAGSVHIGLADFRQDKMKNWFVELPEIQVNNLRPSLLKEPGNLALGKPKPLNFKRVEIHGIKGVLGDRSSFTGEGKLLFSNPTKKAIHNTIFAIPAELLARIGLDLGVLQPVTGTIQYKLQDGKIHFQRFKDVYSDSKLSKFYIPSSANQAWVDFDGNLNLQIRMKQNNLLFKLAELFTFNVKGTLQKPTFTVQQQDRKERGLPRALRAN